MGLSRGFVRDGGIFLKECRHIHNDDDNDDRILRFHLAMIMIALFFFDLISTALSEKPLSIIIPFYIGSMIYVQYFVR